MMKGWHSTKLLTQATRFSWIGCAAIILASAATFPAASFTPPDETAYAYDLSKSFRYAIGKVKPAVVSIHAEQEVERPRRSGSSSNIPDWLRQIFPNDGDEGDLAIPRRNRRDWQGSGVIISPEGEVLTNNHVIEHRDLPADKIRVILDDDRELEAIVVHTDPETDIALIQLQGEGPFPFALLGDSDAMDVGDWVLAIGNPFGLHQTVSQGIISAKGRTDTQVSVTIKDYIQTTAAINLGNSGGPLVNLQGEVIGLNNAIHTAPGVPANIGIGFTIPSNLVKRVINDLKEFGAVQRGFLGVVLARDDQADFVRERFGVSFGALIQEVHRGLPGDRGGLRRGDLILYINGDRVTGYGDLIKKISDYLPGDAVNLTVLRNGDEITLNVVLDQRMTSEEMSQLLTREISQAEEHLGIQVEALTAERALELGYDHDLEGLLVIWAEPGGPAEEMDIQVNDVITEANSRRVRNEADLNQALTTIVGEMNRQNEEGRPLLLEVHRAGSRFFPKYVAVKVRR